MGTREYFDLIDEVNERNFTKKYNLSELSSDLNLNLLNTRYISKVDGYGIFNFDYVRNQVFADDVIKNNQTSELIYINDDRFIVAELEDYKSSEQLSYDDSKQILETLVLNKKTNAAIILNSENTRDDLNAGISNQLDNLSNFIGSIDSADIDEKIKQLFFSISPSKGFVAMKLGSKDYIIFTVNKVIYPEDIDNIKEAEDYYNFAYNTRSESEFKSFYGLFESSAEVNMNDEYMQRD